ncbi:MAG: hypothetical protein LC808_21325 [Actinobacteria bacterium]|nr:hypothetical protein [Actinomycetota bacterium]
MAAVRFVCSRRSLNFSRAAAMGTSVVAGSEQVGALVSITCVEDGHDHRIGDAALGAGHQSGRYHALCGRLVISAPLVAPAGPACPACAEALAEINQRSPSPGGWARLMRWLSGVP